jgi:hypothetical protein
VGPFDLVSTVFISVAVVITVVGQLPIIWEFVVGTKPKFKSPVIAFLGLIALLILLSSVVALHVVSGSNNFNTANTMAQVAVAFAFMPYIAAVIVSIVWWKIDNDKVVSGITFFGAILVGLPALYLLIFSPITLPSAGPLLIAGVFTLIPIMFSFRGWEKKSEK